MNSKLPKNLRFSLKGICEFQLLLGGADLAEEVGWNDGCELFLLQPVHVQAPHNILHAGCRTRLNNFNGTVSRNY
jgi:hypothetical protein